MSTRIAFALFVAAILAVVSGAPTAWGQHGHGGHHGGGHFGGGHFGGGHYGGGHYGGHHFGGGHYGYGLGLHYSPGYLYGWPQYYSPYPTYPYRYYGSYYSGGYVQPRGEYVVVVSRPLAEVASVEIRLPNDQAEVWVQGKKMSGAGAVRRFRSPTLDPSKTYVYTISAAWHEDGRLVTQQRKVDVQANSAAILDFTKAEESIHARTADRTLAPPKTPSPLEEPSGHEIGHSTDK